MVNTKDIKALLNQYLRELFLSTMRQCYADLAVQAQQESLSYEQYLLGLAEQECITRQNNRIERNLKASKAHQVRSLLEGFFVDHKENILAFGNPGSGKTHLLCAIGQELIRKGRKAYFTPCSLLVQELLRAKKELELSRFLKNTLLADRYERSSVMITSNLPFSKWEQIFKDPMVTAAAIDRLVHHSVILELNIESYRMEAAKKNKNKKPDGPAKGSK